MDPPLHIGMAGSQALLAFHDSSGSIITYTTPISNYNPSMQPGDLSFQVSNMSAEYTNNEMIIFAVLGPFSNQTKFNHAWQAGGTVANNILQMHSTTGHNVLSFGEIDFLSG
ncbi:cytochrome b561 and DOMON domain-containing protein At5g48750-like [Apium graveolens]|uniref:cytochrome b561 and DOMON domain-containing protein At5g48750-like n=1 Tax=Apium graveolens TaxID=4045 RepID=UPI003D7924BB